MTKDDVLRMALEAGWTDLREFDSEMSEDFFVGRTQDLERFAKLVYEKAWADTALAATHTVTDAAITKEREACAKVCESLFDLDDDSCSEAEQCAAAIRARSNP